MKVSEPSNESKHGNNQISDKSYDEPEMRTRQKQYIETHGDPLGDKQHQ